MSEGTVMGGFVPGRRRAVTVSVEELVRSEPLSPERALPLLVRPASAGVDLKGWAEGSRDFIDTHLLHDGGILFRGFGVRSVPEFEDFVRAVGGDLLDYSYRSTPRTQVSGKIYTSTEYPADQSIPFHNEQSYTRSWPLKIAFFCVQPAQQGGETPIADSRRVHARIDPAVAERFERLGVMYVRNYGDRLDLPWQDVFQTDDRGQVEAFCGRSGIACEWKDDGRLRTTQVCQGVATHPRTGEKLWFNQAHLFHVSSLPAAVRDELLADLGEEQLPRNTYYGDGSPIEDAALDAIRAAYAAEEVVFPWEEGDLLLLDNMLVAHARKPFAGPRRIVVGMAEPVEAQD